MLFFQVLLLHHAMHSTVKAAAFEPVLQNGLPGVHPRNLLATAPDVSSKGLEIYVQRSPSTALGSFVERAASTELSTLLDNRASDAVSIAGITAVGSIAATCILGWFACLLAIAAVCIIVYMNVDHPVNNVPSTNPRRTLPGPKLTPGLNIHSDFAPTVDCNLHCQLLANVREGEWTHIGNMTHSGMLHQIHHLRNGSVMGLRAYQTHKSETAAVKPKYKRQYDQDEDDNIIGDYYWNFGTTAAYNAFDSTSSIDNEIANDMADYMTRGENWIAACVDLSDSAGLLDDGVFAVGWNNQPYGWASQAALESQIEECNIGNVLHGGILPGPSEDDNL